MSVVRAGVAAEMVDILSVDLQELVEILGRNKGIVLMAPPVSSKDAQKAEAILLSAIKSKQKVKQKTPFSPILHEGHYC